MYKLLPKINLAMPEFFYPEYSSSKNNVGPYGDQTQV